MEKFALTKEKINIQLNEGIQKEVLWVKRKKWKTRSHWSGIPDHWKYRKSKFNQAMEERHNPYCGDSVLAGLE